MAQYYCLCGDDLTEFNSPRGAIVVTMGFIWYTIVQYTHTHTCIHRRYTHKYEVIGMTSFHLPVDNTIYFVGILVSFIDSITYTIRYRNEE